MSRWSDPTRNAALLTALMVTATLGHVARAQEVRLPYWARNHAPIAAIALYNGTYDDPLGLNECWRKGSQLPGPCQKRGGGVTWLISELEERYKIGYRRFMLNLPAGHVKYTHDGIQNGIGFPSAQWHLLDESGIETLPGSTSVRQDFSTLLTPWLMAHPDVQIIIYQGLRFNPAVREPWKSRLMVGSIAPDLTRAFDRLVVQENTKHWLALAPPPTYRRVTSPIGFAFDNTGIESTRDALLAVLEDTTLWGTTERVFISGEAIPHTFPGGDLLQEYVARAPWFGLMRFHQTLDPNASWWAPPGMHLGFAVHNRECEAGHHLSNGEGICEPGYELDAEGIHAAIQSAHDRGFVIIHYGGLHDAFIMNLSTTAIR